MRSTECPLTAVQSVNIGFGIKLFFTKVLTDDWCQIQLFFSVTLQRKYSTKDTQTELLEEVKHGASSFLVVAVSQSICVLMPLTVSVWYTTHHIKQTSADLCVQQSTQRQERQAEADLSQHAVVGSYFCVLISLQIKTSSQ